MSSFLWSRPRSGCWCPWWIGLWFIAPSSAGPNSFSFKSAPDGHRHILSGPWVGQFCKGLCLGLGALSTHYYYYNYYRRAGRRVHRAGAELHSPWTAPLACSWRIPGFPAPRGHEAYEPAAREVWWCSEVSETGTRGLTRAQGPYHLTPWQRCIWDGVAIEVSETGTRKLTLGKGPVSPATLAVWDDVARYLKQGHAVTAWQITRIICRFKEAICLWNKMV